MDVKKSGLFIAKLRKEKGMTQKQLAEKLFVTDRAVSKWERGIGYPDITIITKLAKILEVNVNDILNGEKQEKVEKDNTINESVGFYTKLTKKNIFKKSVVLIPLGIILIYLSIMIFTEINHGYIPFTKQSVQTDNWPSFSNYASKKLEKKFLNALSSYDFESLNDLIYPKDIKSTHKHIEDLKLLKEKGISFLDYKRTSAVFDDEYVFNVQTDVNIEYNNKKATLILLMNKIGKRLDISAITIYDNAQTTDDLIEDEIKDLILRAFNIDYKNIK